MKTVPEMLRKVARANSDRVAVVDGGRRVSYAELISRIGSLSLEFRHRGIVSGDRVALLLPNCLEFVLTYFAACSVGAIVVPMNAQYGESELLYFLQECEVSALITNDEHEELCRQVIKKAGGQCQLFVGREIGQAESMDGGEEFQLPEIDRSAPVMFQFSSGSTGKPKCIARNHENLLFELDSLKTTLSLSNEDRFLGLAPFSHVNGLMRSMMASLSAGAALYTVPMFDRKKVAELISRNRISVFIAVPFMFGMLARTRFTEPPDFSSLRLCVSASAPMPEKVNREFKGKFGIYVRQLYGSTETGTISVNLSSDIDRSLLSVGTPIEGVKVEVFSDELDVVPTGRIGEFAVASPAVISSYEGGGEVGAEAFKRGYFFTGDLGYRDEHGLLYLAGRKKFFINKGGYKINPQEIEDLLMDHPKVEEAAVVGVPTAFQDEKVKAIVVLSEPCREEDLVEFCRRKIADFKIPSLIEFRDALPKSPTGKIRKKLLL
jgi:long-chain acyl-CoA synthetase